MDLYAETGLTAEEAGLKSVLNTRFTSTLEQSSLKGMPQSQVSLVPSNLARPPMMWSAQEVKAWLEFCVEEFSLSTVCVDKFDMNGKALLLLTRMDFMERAPQAGDVIYNVFQRLIQQESPAFLRSSLFLTQPAHLIPTTDNLSRTVQTNNSRLSYVPIRPSPQQSVKGNISSAVYPACSSMKTRSIDVAVNEDISFTSPGVPASMLSPAPSEKCPSDTESSHDDNVQSPHASDLDMDGDESMAFNSLGATKYDTSETNDDGVCRLLWEFIYQLLQDTKYTDLVIWESVDELTFRIMNPTNLAEAWGKQKNRSNMTYEKLSRALRYYYKMNIIKKVPGKRLTYKFLQHPTTIRRGQRGARPHSMRTSASGAGEKHAVTGAIAPDSSECQPLCTLSTSSISGMGSTLGNDTNSLQHPEIFDEISQSHTRKSPIGHDQHHIMCFPEGSHGPRLVCFHDSTDIGAVEATKNASTSQTLSAVQHLQTMQSQLQLSYCNSRENFKTDSKDTKCRSQNSTVNQSLQRNQNLGPYRMINERLKSISPLSITPDHPHSDINTLSSSFVEEHLLLHNNHRFHYHEPADSLKHEMDNFQQLPASGSPPCTLSLSAASRCMTPLLLCTTTTPKDREHSRLYTNKPLRYHPYSTCLASCHIPQSSYLSGKLCSTQDNYRQNLQLKNESPLSFEKSSDMALQHPQAHYTSHHQGEQVYQQEQDEPEDLSLKTSLSKKDESDRVKSESDLARSEVEDAPRDSPQSCSSDSAYCSDRADYGKDSSVEELHD